MAIYYAPCIVYGGTRFYLPPWLEVETTRSQRVDIMSPPGASNAVITDIKANQGTTISLSVMDIPATPSTRTILNWFEYLWDAMSGREFKFFTWSDRGWDNCALQTIREKVTLDPLTVLQETPIQIISANSAPSTSLQLDFDPDYDTAYPYASIVGRPSGTASTPGELIPVTEPANANYPSIWPGVNSGASVSGDEHVFVIGGTTGSQWDIRGIQITSAENAMATGTTTFRLSTVAIGAGGGSQIDISLLSSETFTGETAVDISVTAGDSVYLYRTAGGDHQNIQIRFRCEAQ